MSVNSNLRFLNMVEMYGEELDEGFKKDEKIDKLEKSCTQKVNEIEELKKKIQREQTWKSNARKQLKQRTKQRDELLKKIKNNATL